MSSRDDESEESESRSLGSESSRSASKDSSVEEISSDDGDEVDEKEEESEGDGDREVPQRIPGNVSIFQCLCGMRDIFMQGAACGESVLNTNRLKPLFEGDARAMTLLSDERFLDALNAMYTACDRDESLMLKLREKCVDGRLRRKRGDASAATPAKRPREANVEISDDE
jgi:hypothetical protein